MKTTAKALVALLFIAGCSSADHRGNVVASSSKTFEIPLSKLTFSQIDIEGTPADIVLELNRAMKGAGFPVGLTIGGQFILKKTHLRMRNVTLRQVIDQMCVQLRISYWDNARLRELYLNDGEASSFFMDAPGQDGKYTPAGPPQFMPTGFASLPFRAAYFDRTIEDLARERSLERNAGQCANT